MVIGTLLAILAFNMLQQALWDMNTDNKLFHEHYENVCNILEHNVLCCSNSNTRQLVEKLDQVRSTLELIVHYCGNALDEKCSKTNYGNMLPFSSNKTTSACIVQLIM